ncbi:MAG TPA: hypothetical protein VFI61_00450 [Patescibacteria group bacterium]|nr:hypothetical protein [Patescibacteria group bacterium]
MEQQSLNKFDFKKNLPFIVGAFLVVILGVGTAWMLKDKIMTGGSKSAAPGVTVTSTEAGILDPSGKYDTATGDLKEGGIDNEGTHHLEVIQGPSHFVYLTSSMIDLQSFVGKKVQVWGQTQASKKAPWLIDVSKIKIAE